MTGFCLHCLATAKACLCAGQNPVPATQCVRKRTVTETDLLTEFDTLPPGAHTVLCCSRCLYKFILYSLRSFHLELHVTPNRNTLTRLNNAKTCKSDSAKCTEASPLLRGDTENKLQRSWYAVTQRKASTLLRGDAENMVLNVKWNSDANENMQRRLLACNNGRHNTVMTSTQNFEIICNATSMNPTQPTDATYTETRKKLLRRINNNKSILNTWNVTSVTRAKYIKASRMLYDDAENTWNVTTSEERKTK